MRPAGLRLKLQPEFPGQAGDHLVVGVVDPFEQQGIGNRAIEDHHVPVFLVEMPGGLNGGVAFAQFQGFFRVAFKADGGEGIHIGQGKHLAHDLKHQGLLVEGEAFGDSLFGQAVVAEGLDIHSIVGSLEDDGRAVPVGEGFFGFL